MKGFDVANYKLTAKEEGWARNVNDLVEALADGVGVDDIPEGIAAGKAIAEGIMDNSDDKLGIMALGIKLLTANVLDEIAEMKAEIKAKDKTIAALKKRLE